MSDHFQGATKMVTLAADVSRCVGVGDDLEGWREGCAACLRRTSAPSGPHQVWIDPPPIVAFWCEFLIEGER